MYFGPFFRGKKGYLVTAFVSHFERGPFRSHSLQSSPTALLRGTVTIVCQFLRLAGLELGQGKQPALPSHTGGGDLAFRSAGLPNAPLLSCLSTQMSPES